MSHELVCTWQLSVHLPIASRHLRAEAAEDVLPVLEDHALRIQRAREVVELLTTHFAGWSVRQNGHEVVLVAQSDAVDVPGVQGLLREHGIGAGEAVVRVQYARRWGIL